MKVKGVTMNMLQNALSRMDNGKVIQVKVFMNATLFVLIYIHVIFANIVLCFYMFLLHLSS